MTPQEALRKLINIYRSKSGESGNFKNFISLPENKKEIGELTKIIIQDATQATEFALYCNERWIEAEEIIKTNQLNKQKHILIL